MANPGCFSSAAILGLAPLVAANHIALDSITVTGLSGTAGAGAELARAAHHPEIGNNLVAYNVVGHRHTFEMEQELSAIAGKALQVHFTPVYVPITRGILDICRVQLDSPIDREDMLDVFHRFYEGHPFIQIYDQPKDPPGSWQYRPYPWVSAIAGTNYCQIGLDVDEKRNRIVVFSVLDSLGKGGSHVGIQNFNLICDLEESLGINRLGNHPY